MKRLNQILLASAALFGFTMAGHATIIVNQTNWLHRDPAESAIILKTNQNFPVSASWQCGTAANYIGTNGYLETHIGGGSLTMWSYFADSNAPVSVAPGEMLRVMVTMTFSNVAPQNSNRHFRWGLMWAGTNMPPHTNTGTIRNNHIMGYGQDMNFGSTFGLQPLSLFAETNTETTEAIISKSAEFIGIGDNGGGTTNDPGFLDGIPYQFIMTIVPSETNSVDITSTVIGSTFNNGFITQTVTDAAYACTNFDLFVVRPNGNTSTFGLVNITKFKVEKLSVVPPAPQLTSIKKQGTSAIITWNCEPGYTYTVLKTNDLANLIATWPAIVTGYPAGFTEGSSISYTDTAATAGTAFYLIKSP